MRIHSIHVRRHGGEGSGPMGPAGRAVLSREGVVVTLTDERGNTGVGEASSDPRLDVSELASWTLVASQLLNLDEFLTK